MKGGKKKAYTTKTPKGDFVFKHQEQKKPYVTALQMALARGKGDSNKPKSRHGGYGFNPHKKQGSKFMTIFD